MDKLYEACITFSIPPECEKENLIVLSGHGWHNQQVNKFEKEIRIVDSSVHSLISCLPSRRQTQSPEDCLLDVRGVLSIFVSCQVVRKTAASSLHF